MQYGYFFLYIAICHNSVFFLSKSINGYLGSWDINNCYGNVLFFKKSLVVVLPLKIHFLGIRIQLQAALLQWYKYI